MIRPHSASSRSILPHLAASLGTEICIDLLEDPGNDRLYLKVREGSSGKIWILNLTRFRINDTLFRGTCSGVKCGPGRRRIVYLLSGLHASDALGNLLPERLLAVLSGPRPEVAIKDAKEADVPVQLCVTSDAILVGGAAALGVAKAVGGHWELAGCLVEHGVFPACDPPVRVCP